jgi:hypothetical protein
MRADKMKRPDDGQIQYPADPHRQDAGRVHQRRKNRNVGKFLNLRLAGPTDGIGRGIHRTGDLDFGMKERREEGSQCRHDSGIRRTAGAASDAVPEQAAAGNLHGAQKMRGFVRLLRRRDQHR